MIRDHCILIVEDEPLILMDLEYAAQKRGCDTLIASSVATALRLVDFCKDRIDVAVLDLDLGQGSTSIGVARELKQHGIPFVWHSGSLAADKARSKGIHDEVDAPFVDKPADARSVVEAALACRGGDTSAADHRVLEAAD